MSTLRPPIRPPIYPQGLPTRLEVLAIARDLGTTRDRVAVGVLEVAAWFSRHGRRGQAKGVRSSDLSDVVNFPGLAEAMTRKGLLAADPDGTTRATGWLLREILGVVGRRAGSGARP